jgi:uncharacterized protein
MKKLFILLLLAVTAQAQTPPSGITIGHVDSLYSNILGETRKVWVYVPEEQLPGIHLPSRYPVVYLLDGEAHFYLVMGMIQQLSQVNGNTVLPEMILVGITNTNRTRDLTPTRSEYDPFGNAEFLKESGGGEKFTEFLKKELIPHIDSLYPTTSYRTLIGHSFGGLMVVNTLIHHTELFNAYVAIDPSMWWEKQKLIRQAESVLKQKSFQDKTFYLATANALNSSLTVQQIKEDTSSYTEHTRSIFQLADVVKQSSRSGLTYHSQYYDKDDHGSVPLISTHDALRFIFSYYKIPMDLNAYLNKEFDITTVLTSHFNTVTQRMNYQVLPPEYYVNALGYQFMSLKHWKKAESLFQLNVKNYPTSANVYDSLADCYDAMGEKQKAIENYTRSLTIKELPNTKQKLAKLMAEK